MITMRSFNFIRNYNVIRGNVLKIWPKWNRYPQILPFTIIQTMQPLWWNAIIISKRYRERLEISLNHTAGGYNHSWTILRKSITVPKSCHKRLRPSINYTTKGYNRPQTIWLKAVILARIHKYSRTSLSFFFKRITNSTHYR